MEEIELNIHLIQGIAYGQALDTFPIALSICSKNRIDLATKVDIKEFSLIDANGKTKAGYLRRAGVSVFRNTFEVHRRRKFFCYDILEVEPLQHPLKEGHYNIVMRIVFYKKDAAGYTPIETHCEKGIDIS